MSNRIIIEEGFEAQRDQYGWTLVQMYEGTNKNGDIVPREHKTYYASFAQCCQAVADKKAGKCDSCEQVMAMWRDFIDQIKDVTRGVK